MRKVQFISAGISIGQELEGVRSGPEGWRDYFRLHFPQLLGCDWSQVVRQRQIKAFHLHSNSDSSDFPFQMYDDLTQLVLKSLSRAQLPVTLGGDHSLAMATVQASLLHHPRSKVLWVDAHGDINTPETSLSGRVHGMPLAYLLGLWAQDRRRVRLLEKNVVLFGIRDLDTGEKKILRDLKVRSYSRSEISKKGIEFCWAEAMSYLNVGSEGLHVSFDVDALDPRLFPQTGVPVARGLNVSETQFLFDQILIAPNLKAFDLVEYNPELTPKKEVKLDGRKLIGSFLTQLACQKSHYSAFSDTNFLWPHLA